MTMRRILLRSTFVGLAVLILLVLFAHPFFAITRPEGKPALVVEGWIHQEGIKNAKALFDEGGYTHVYVTGTLRPFTYYLLVGDTLEVRLKEPESGLWEMEITGLPGTGYEVSVDGVQKDGAVLTKAVQHSSLSEMADGISVLRITAIAKDAPPYGEPVLFISGSRIAGTDLHNHGPELWIRHADGSSTEGTPTHAHQGAMHLQQSGIPRGLITAVPSWSDTDRTHTGARSMAQYARLHAMDGYDVATLGVHARRTWIQYRAAYPEGRIGVVALEDPWCRRWNWWLNPYGWYQVMKELIALPGTWFVTDTVVDEEQSVSFRHADP